MLKTTLGLMLVIAPNFLMIIAVVLALIGIVAYSSYQASEKNAAKINDIVQKASDALVQVKEDGNMEVGIVAGEVANLSAIERQDLAIKKAAAMNSDDINVVLAAITGEDATYNITPNGIYHSGLFEKLVAPEFRVTLKHHTENRRIYQVLEGKTNFIILAERSLPWRGQYLEDKEGKRHDYYWQVNACVVVKTCLEECVLALSAKLQDILNESSVTMIRENLKEVKHYEATKKGPEVVFMQASLVPQDLTNDQLNNFYAPVKYTVGNQNVVVKMKDFVNACTKALTMDLNVFLCGKPGTGKTRLATFLLGQLSLSDENVTILRVNAALLKAMTGDNSFEFIQFLDRHARGENKVVIYIDDAHKALGDLHDELKSMLDGTFTTTYHIAVLASMNESSEALKRDKPDLVREGRVSMFDINPLTPEQANIAASFIAADPTMKRIRKTPYTKETTLAVLFDGFTKVAAPNPFKVITIAPESGPTVISV